MPVATPGGLYTSVTRSNRQVILLDIGSDKEGRTTAFYSPVQSWANFSASHVYEIDLDTFFGLYTSGGVMGLPTGQFLVTDDLTDNSLVTDERDGSYITDDGVFA